RQNRPGSARDAAQGLLRHAVREAARPPGGGHVRQGIQAEQVGLLPLGYRVQLRHADQGRRQGVRGSAGRAMILVIGNKNYWSWSMRPWIAMKVLGLKFDEKYIPLYGPGAKEQILLESPAGKVPILIDGGVRIWGSLAILEYLAEKHPLWPTDRVA